jgi:hypothetical protein
MNDTPDTLMVRDLLAVQAPRVHEVAPGKRFTLKADEDTALPYEFAQRLVGSEGFEVRMVTAEGKAIVLRHQQANDAKGDKATLRADQVIAELGELTGEALAKRCAAAIPDTRFHARSNKAEMVEALIQIAMAKPQPAEVEIDPSVDDAPYQRAA